MKEGRKEKKRKTKRKEKKRKEKKRKVSNDKKRVGLLFIYLLNFI